MPHHLNEGQQKYLNEQKARIKNRFKSKHSPGFRSGAELGDWYINKLIELDFHCYYCETSIFDINKLIFQGLLITRCVGPGGKGMRGPVLEIDKKVNEIGYSPDNCTLSCYYCNNDKSYTLADEDYKRFFGETRNRYFNYLLESCER